MGASAALVWTALLWGADTAASTWVASMPQAIYWGPPGGPAAMSAGDWSRANRAEALPSGADAAVSWHRQIPGGVSCNLLVDAAGDIFVVGTGRVTQLNQAGQREYSQPADITSAVTATLLADGTRVALSAEGQLRAWSATGAAQFSVELPSPNRWVDGALLPLPDGGLLVSGGVQLLDLDAAGHVRARAKMKHPVHQTLVLGARGIIIDEHGGIYEWGGFELMARRESFPGRVVAVAASGDASLVALMSPDSSLVEVSLATGVSHELARVAEPGLLPPLSVAAPGQVGAIRRDGIRFWLGQDIPVAAGGRSLKVADSVRGALLLGGPDGAFAWLTADRALRLANGAEQEREVPEVRCGEPESLVSAGARRLLVACRSGELWLIGPANAPVTPSASDRYTPPRQLSPS
jgi:hypothetical protein